MDKCIREHSWPFQRNVKSQPLPFKQTFVAQHEITVALQMFEIVQIWMMAKVKDWPLSLVIIYMPSFGWLHIHQLLYQRLTVFEKFTFKAVHQPFQSGEETVSKSLIFWIFWFVFLGSFTSISYTGKFSCQLIFVNFAASITPWKLNSGKYYHNLTVHHYI